MCSPSLRADLIGSQNQPGANMADRATHAIGQDELAGGSVALFVQWGMTIQAPRVADLPPGSVAPTLAASVPPDLPDPPEFPDIGPPPLPVGEPASLSVQPLGGFPTGLTINLLSVGFVLPVDAEGLVIAVNIDEEAGVIQLDGASVPILDFDTPAGPAALEFSDRLFEGTIDHETGFIEIPNVLVNLSFLGSDLPHAFTLSTGIQILPPFFSIGRALDEETGEVVLAGVILGPPSGFSPPIVTALVIEGILRGH